jgi:CheY-like chemotaxis protein
VQSGRPRRILIIEDNADAALTLKDSIEVHGHEVRVALDALEGIEIAREFRPDVLLCDIGLPTMDGYQVASKFRSDDGLKSVFLIAVTGYAAPEDQERAARAGFDRHFRKPPDIERLQQILDQLDLR